MIYKKIDAIISYRLTSVTTAAIKASTQNPFRTGTTAPAGGVFGVIVAAVIGPAAMTTFVKRRL